MAIELKIRKIGNSLGVVLPKEALAQLKVDEGQSLFLSETTDHSYRIAKGDPKFVQQMEVAEDVVRRYRETLKELAK